MRARTGFVGLLLLALGAGCGKDSAKIRLIPNVIAGAQAGADVATAGGLTSRAGALVGSGTAMDLQSLKYFISSIQLCQDVTPMGSGYSHTAGCINLYATQAAGVDYNSYDAP